MSLNHENSPNKPRKSQPAYVHKKTAKGRVYYYFGPTGKRLSNDYDAAVLEARNLVAELPVVESRRASMRRGEQFWRARIGGAARAAEHRANQAGREFSLDPEELLEQARRQKYRCALSGLPFSRKRYSGKASRDPFGLSIDRIDCRKGYTPDNVRLVLTAVNVGLGDWGDSVFRKIAAGVASMQMQ